jgi:hypothetical protein
MGVAGSDEAGEDGMSRILQDDALDLQNWVFGALHPNAQAGSFVRAFAEACARADAENYAVLRPALLAIAKKYPDYRDFDAIDNPARTGTA